MFVSQLRRPAGSAAPPLAAFARRLLDSGGVLVPSLAVVLDPTETDQQQTLERLAGAEAMLRREGPDGLPPWQPEAAFWALQFFGWAAVTILDRSLDQTQPPSFRGDPPDPADPANHWSVDVVLRFLPELAHRSELAAPQDALQETLRAVAARWPLSAVGMDVAFTEASLQVVLGDAGLRRHMVDRVIARQDHRLAQHPAVQRVLVGDAGAFVDQLNLKAWLPSPSSASTNPPAQADHPATTDDKAP